ncbi:alpha/beta fold hydrolase [Salinisphaera aquimarina]|uniref:Alpha/beta fold hydrolase n=1 Tax=Salinisphaera aquimarina TaxID=2094031 RepID=A0ABV7ELA8_9GAMM
MTHALHNAPTADESISIRGDGVQLACHSRGDSSAPTLVFVHGYPDTHAVWGPVIDVLSQTFHCVSYDVRGAGASTRPRATRAYLLAYLEADLRAVIDWASPDAPVHLIAHDWGSIQSWEAVTDPRLADRIASFTSMSGPCLDHVGHWLRGQWQTDRPALKKQARRSWYIAAFHVPLLPSLIWRTVLVRRWPTISKRLEGQSLPVNPTLAQDGAHGIKLYRANVAARLFKPRARTAQCPVQLITPLRDAFVGPGFAHGLERWVEDLTVTPIDAAHWAVLTHPQSIAEHCVRFIRRHGPASPTLPAAQSPARPGPTA